MIGGLRYNYSPLSMAQISNGCGLFVPPMTGAKFKGRASLGNVNSNLCRRCVKNRNSSIFARLSPRQYRRPGVSKDKEEKTGTK